MEQPLGAEVLRDSSEPSSVGAPIDHSESILPDPNRASTDVPPMFKDGCHALREETTFSTCEYGLREGGVKVALVGDSHAGQWMPALQEVAKDRGWSLRVGTKSACPFLDAPLTYSDKSDYWQCAEWHDNALTELQYVLKPDVLFVSYSNYAQFSKNGQAALTDGAISTLRKIRDSGSKIVILRDTPSFPVNIAECVDANRTTLSRCALPREEAILRRDRTQETVAAASSATLIDLLDAICPADRCAPVIGGVLVWRDDNHLTATYARSLASRLALEVAHLGW
ncbi:SGNH hydrolase domain-containing protein [Rhodococcus rhodochrous]|uniref:SGNH hydrolase domain-containing protein n=1 Tax=Rhodococcus rhodochrous TaxID=1829 RepID=UPI001CE3AC14|nr:SGNH hydrolase domain-containing protein [Rhodococcus rhodochrous]